jgi:hypothetical protein
MKKRRTLTRLASVVTMTIGLLLFGGLPAHADDGLGRLIGKDGLIPIDLRLGTGGGDGGGSTATTPRRSSSTASTQQRPTAGQGTSGHRIDLPVPVPVTVCGIEVGVGGKAEGDCPDKDKDKGESAAETTHQHALPGNKGGLLSDNQVNVPISVPVTVCGNAVALLGDARASCDRPQEQAAGVPYAQPAAAADDPGTGGVLAGNGLNVSAEAPLTVCGNAVGIAGDADDSCDDSGKPGQPPGQEPPPEKEPPPGQEPGDGDEGQDSGTEASANGAVVGKELPFTGTPLDTLLSAAAGFLLIGTAALRLSRRRRSPSRRSQPA